MGQVSVIVCSCNPRPDYLRRVLASLRAQTLPVTEWELLLIDNASKPRLADVWDLTWHPRQAIIYEEEPGLTAARLRGIKESTGGLIVFVDDDNVVQPNYLERTLEITQAYPQLRVFGAGVLRPEFEVEPRPEVRPLLSLLGLRTVTRVLWTNNPADSYCIPWGAGLCVTRETAEEYVKLVARLEISHLLDRRGQRLFSGGDDLFSWVSARSGSGFGLFPTLEIDHLVRASRVQEPYLLQLVYDHAYSHGILRFVLSGEQQPQVQFADSIRILLHGVRRGRFSMRCHWAAARGSARAARDIAAQGMRPVERSDLAF